ncbi:biliverdin-producing heme oxygenase [Actinomadura parmotrematis]|uniref:Biliverdin-producing heme oxygenase n=1 Tax=Actinomadura parmotrematis TaxID=2864039 RepID=A0ABS7FSM5_9ACTN|nr:biliverdin-producing heme oxygenase [Actinomadura parmotrematis]MBW8483419.1 biliverdin-producing heme oxygenase [Actinomadura parmotrematis]
MAAEHTAAHTGGTGGTGGGDAAEAGFAAELRAATWSDHGDNETSPYMAALVEGRLGREEYGALVVQLHHVYDALETAADAMAGDPVAARFDVPDLRRRAALEADLAYLYGPAWRDRLAPTPETAAYTARVREVATASAGGFVAHHYTRYLGDLSGGQFIGRQVQRALGVGRDDDGVAFYRFPGKPKAYKDAYRALLDTAPWDAAERAAVIAEVKVAYRLNAALTDGLGRALRVEPAA